MDLIFPVQVTARPRYREAQMAFFQSCALPSGYVDALHLMTGERGVVRSFAQWRLDFPRGTANVLTPHQVQVLAVAEAILTRGTTPFCSCQLEDVLAIPGELGSHSLMAAVRRVALRPSSGFQSLTHDSEEERLFGVWLEQLCQRFSLPWVFISQVELASLNPATETVGQRGDLLLVHPLGEQPPILVEVDGKQHDEHRGNDKARDDEMETVGVRVVRVPAAEVRNGQGTKLSDLSALLLGSRDGGVDLPGLLDQPVVETPLSQTLRWFKFAHQLQIVLLTALKTGWIRFGHHCKVGVVVPPALAGYPKKERVLGIVATEFWGLVCRLSRLCGEPLVETMVELIPLETGKLTTIVDLFVGPADGSVDKLASGAPARFLISDVCFPREVQAPMTPSSPARFAAPQREDARWFLKYLFRKDDFWEGQWETVERLLRGQDTVVLLPTGAGKSIAFQLAAMLLPGRCLVVDPIIALIEDQIDNLALAGIDRCIGISSQLNTQERVEALKAFRAGHYLFCYVAPERLQIKAFRDALRTLTVNMPVSLIAIDEAHCVSEWGHDFRTAYLNLGRITRERCASQGVVPPLVALTGTASKIVLKDVQRELEITELEAIVTPKTFDRPELHYRVLKCPSNEKAAAIEGVLRGLPTQFGLDHNTFFHPNGQHTRAGLVFCPHAKGSFGVVEVRDKIVGALGVSADVYSGELSALQRQRVAQGFKRNEIPLLVCTKAFGMGIDKPNIRYTIHIGLPPSIESFYQEAGRSGRDRQRAECALILSDDNPRRSNGLLPPAVPLETMAQQVDRVNWADSDDIIRMLYFHVRAFRGIDAEMETVKKLLDVLGELETRREVHVCWRDARWGSTSPDETERRGRVEKSLHRLVVIGVVKDYTVDYAAGEFAVSLSGAGPEDIASAYGRYIGAYQRGLGRLEEAAVLALERQPFRSLVQAVVGALVKFIYERIERARRHALSEILNAARTCRTDEDFRRRILERLEESEWDERLEALLKSELGGLDRVDDLLDSVTSANDAAELRGATNRALESFPDVPGLRLLRAVAEALCPDCNAELVRQNVDAALGFAIKDYQVDIEDVARTVGAAAEHLDHHRPNSGRSVIQTILESSYAERRLARAFINHTDCASDVPLAWLRNNLLKCSALMRLMKGNP
jgi:ATP-dependent DNA helicase RecQ